MVRIVFQLKINYELFFPDQLTINVATNNLLIGKGTTAQITATANGINTDESNFIYQWMKRGSNSLPDKVSGVNETILTIPNVTDFDEGQYYCIVINEWGTSLKSDDVTLTVYGMLIYIIYVM